MVKVKMCFCGLASALFLSGCFAPTRAVVREFDGEGRLVRECETSESVVASLTKTTASKSVVVWESGWAAYLTATAATLENPTPQIRLFAGKTDRGMISALPGETHWAEIAEAVRATKYDLSVSGDGVRSTSAGMP